jgi:hypothetical protein
MREISFDLEWDDSPHISLGLLIWTISLAILLSFAYFLNLTHFGDWVELTLDNLFSLI